MLLLTFCLVGAPALVLIIRHWHRHGWQHDDADSTVSAPKTSEEESPLRWRWFLHVYGLVFGGLGVLLFLSTDSVILLWWWLLVLTGTAWCVIAPDRTLLQLQRPVSRRSLEKALWLVAVACIVLSLIAHRPDIDDAFYVNVAVAAADSPDQPLLRNDTMHGIDGLRLHLPVYRVHSYELANGLLAYLTGIPAIYCFHWLSAVLAALLLPLAYARLWRTLLPRLWLPATITTVLILVAVGETHRWYGNFGLVRIWQGKAIFLSVLLPLIQAYAIRFALQPKLWRWLLLVAAQIAAVGCTSSALWIAPFTTFVALVCAVRPNIRGLLTVSLGCLSSLYILLAGLLVKQNLDGLIRQIKELPHGKMLNVALKTVLGNHHLLWFGVASLMLAWVFCRRGLAQRFTVCFSLASALLLIPFLDLFVRTNITGLSYWRCFWGAPLPVMMTIVLISPLQLRASRVLRALLFTIVVGLFVALIPRFSVLSQQNNTTIGWPSLKVDRPEYQLAEVLNRSVPGQSTVAAPDLVSAWVPTFHHHAYPLAVRKYLRRKPLQAGREYRLRTGARQYVSGSCSAQDERSFRRAINRLDVQGVCLQESTCADDARNLLRRRGFAKTYSLNQYEIWVRNTDPGESER
jgi:hypothetical protein